MENKECCKNTNNHENHEKSERGYILPGYVLPVSILSASIILAGAMLYSSNAKSINSNSKNNGSESATQTEQELLAREEKIGPSKGVTLPARWDDLGKRMVETGVIDEAQFKALYNERGGLPEGTEALLTSSGNGQLVINRENSGALLNLLWALGLGNKSDVLEQGPMQDPQYGGAGNFAATGGWTIAKGDAMDHYSKHKFITLSAEQKLLVEKVSKGIFRPCCGNSTYFPDCNHGMAMLGLLELMASQGATEEQMYKSALAVNSYWFPETYINIAKYLEGKGIDWNAVDPKEILGASYSSAQGYKQILSQVEPVQKKSSGGCGV
ncbi:MAG: hypothetical protein AAB626_00175 [Patescibacteria group bacterium]